MSSPGTTVRWQARTSGTPFTTTRQSKQTPIPQNTPRGRAFRRVSARSPCPGQVVRRPPSGRVPPPPERRPRGSRHAGTSRSDDGRAADAERLRVDMRPRSGEQLREQPAGGRGQADPGTLVAGRVPQAGQPGSAPITGRWSGAYGRSRRTRASRAPRRGTGTGPAPSRRARAARTRTVSSNPIVPGWTRSAPCRRGWTRPRSRSAGPRHCCRPADVVRVVLVPDTDRQWCGDQQHPASRQDLDRYAGPERTRSTRARAFTPPHGIPCRRLQSAGGLAGTTYPGRRDTGPDPPPRARTAASKVVAASTSCS